MVNTVPSYFKPPGYKPWPQRLAFLAKDFPDFHPAAQADTKIASQMKPHPFPLKFVTICVIQHCVLGGTSRIPL